MGFPTVVLGHGVVDVSYMIHCDLRMSKRFHSSSNRIMNCFCHSVHSKKTYKFKNASKHEVRALIITLADT